MNLSALLVIFLARLLSDTGVRMMYPYIPHIAAGLGLTPADFGWILSARGVAGVSGPFFGLLADRFGRRAVMAASLAVQSLTAIGLTLSRGGWAVIPMVVMGLSLAALIPAQQAYISDRVPYRQRGRVIGAVELSWAITGIIMLPAVGWLIDRAGWRWPFVLVGLVGMLVSVVLRRGLPPANRQTAAERLTWVQARQIISRGNVRAAVGLTLLVFTALSMFFSMWGLWLSAEYGASAVVLGGVATAIGFAELSGSLGSSLFIDRLGKKRGSLAGLLLAAIAVVLLPLTRGQMVYSIAGLVIIGGLLEFVIVSLLPLYSEQVPAARGTMMSLIFMGISSGTALGALLATQLWAGFGLPGILVLEMACLLLSAGILYQWLHE